MAASGCTTCAARATRVRRPPGSTTTPCSATWSRWSTPTTRPCSGTTASTAGTCPGPSGLLDRVREVLGGKGGPLLAGVGHSPYAAVMTVTLEVDEGVGTIRLD